MLVVIFSIFLVSMIIYCAFNIPKEQSEVDRAKRSDPWGKLRGE